MRWNVRLKFHIDNTLDRDVIMMKIYQVHYTNCGETAVQCSTWLTEKEAQEEQKRLEKIEDYYKVEVVSFIVGVPYAPYDYLNCE